MADTLESLRREAGLSQVELARRCGVRQATLSAIEGGRARPHLDGEIYAMAGGTPDHAALAGMTIRLLGAKLPRGCRVFTSDLRVRVTATGFSTYPDATVIYGRTLRAPDDAVAVVNPVLVVEVTSPSTEDYDRGEKLRNYQQITSLTEVLIVSHREPRLIVVRRVDGGQWALTEASTGQSVSLASIGGHIAVDDVYRDALEDAR